MTAITVIDVKTRGTASKGISADRKARGALAAAIFTRMGDVVLATVLILLTLPLIGITALAIKSSTFGPVFIRCRRVAPDGRQIVILRFCITGQRLRHSRPTMCWEQPLTPVGRLLCRTRLDALPQLINVLRGEMTLVGKLQERPDFMSRR